MSVVQFHPWPPFYRVANSSERFDPMELVNKDATLHWVVFRPQMGCCDFSVEFPCTMHAS